MSDPATTLRSLGADGSVLQELIDYTENPYRNLAREDLFNLEDEPQLEAWRDYVAEAEQIGTVATLARRLVQFAFPVRKGMSQEPAYRASLVRSEPPPDGDRAQFLDPEGLALRLHLSPAGLVPVIEARAREDFTTLIRVLVGRSEPIEVPETMGACLVRGLINQDRVKRYRSAWAAARGGDEAAAWKREMGRLAPRKNLYQDRLIVLSTGPYSAVSASEMNLTEGDWLTRSGAIRLDHECLHYLTLRATGLVRRHVLDEIVADLAGLLAAEGRYDHRIALRFLGIEGHLTGSPRLTDSARLRIYLDEARLSPTAERLLLGLIVRVTAAIDHCLENHPDLNDPERRTELLMGTLRLGLTELGDRSLTVSSSRLSQIA